MSAAAPGPGSISRWYGPVGAVQSARAGAAVAFGAASAVDTRAATAKAATTPDMRAGRTARTSWRGGTVPAGESACRSGHPGMGGRTGERPGPGVRAEHSPGHLSRPSAAAPPPRRASCWLCQVVTEPAMLNELGSRGDLRT